MIEQLEDMPPGVLGFRAIGTIEASDYREVLDPAFDAVLADQEQLNLVLVMGDRFDHVSLGAMLEDAKLITFPHEVWGRAAFVTNHEVLGGIARAFGGRLCVRRRSVPNQIVRLGRRLLLLGHVPIIRPGRAARTLRDRSPGR